MGLIGIIADTHDNVANIRKAVALFRKENVEFVFHLGNITSPATVKLFKGLRVRFVAGNEDKDIANIARNVRDIGGQIGNYYYLIEGGKTIAAIHGENRKAVDKLAGSRRFDYVLHGNVHTKRLEKVGKRTTIVNPGGHYPEDSQAIVFLDPEKGKIRFVSLKSRKRS